MFSRQNYTEGSQRAEKGPCKACHAFKEWTKLQNKENAQDTPHPEGKSRAAMECPLDKDELGQATWGFLHTMAAYYPQKPSKDQQCMMVSFFKTFSNFYPCEVCASHFQQDVKDNPPDVSSSEKLSTWLCKMHNRVNVRMGKPEFDCSRVMERWKDGWRDGSCD